MHSFKQKNEGSHSVPTSLQSLTLTRRWRISHCDSNISLRVSAISPVRKNGFHFLPPLLLLYLVQAELFAYGAAGWGGGAAAESGMSAGGALTINTENFQVYKSGRPIELTQREYELLTFLASHPDKVFSRVDLMEQVWNYGYVGDDVRTVDVTVRRLREKIEDDPASPRYILTRRGVGYYYSTL